MNIYVVVITNSVYIQCLSDTTFSNTPKHLHVLRMCAVSCFIGPYITRTLWLQSDLRVYFDVPFLNMTKCSKFLQRQGEKKVTFTFALVSSTHVPYAYVYACTANPYTRWCCLYAVCICSLTSVLPRMHSLRKTRIRLNAIQCVVLSRIWTYFSLFPLFLNTPMRILLVAWAAY